MTRTPISKCILGTVLGLVLVHAPCAGAAPFDPPPFHRLPEERFHVDVFRWAIPSSYYVNLGLPGEFFSGVERISDLPLVYSVHAVEYGVRVGGWPLQRLYLHAALPFQSVSLVEQGVGGAAGTARQMQKGGDLEWGGCLLALGSRTSDFTVGLNGWVRFPTGTRPMDLVFPLMSSGKGAFQAAGGCVASQKAGRFSFFQGLNYEKTGSIPLRHFHSRMTPAVFQWPDTLHAAVRAECRVFRRSYRIVTLFYDLRMRKVGDMTYDGEVLVPGDRFLFSSGGLRVKVDPEFSVTGQYSYYPFEIDDTKGRPDFGGLLTLTVSYTPF